MTAINQSFKSGKHRLQIHSQKLYFNIYLLVLRILHIKLYPIIEATIQSSELQISKQVLSKNYMKRVSVSRTV